jgi:hypothetical protein
MLNAWGTGGMIAELFHAVPHIKQSGYAGENSGGNIEKLNPLMVQSNIPF